MLINMNRVALHVDVGIRSSFFSPWAFVFPLGSVEMQSQIAHLYTESDVLFAFPTRSVSDKVKKAVY